MAWQQQHSVIKISAGLIFNLVYIKLKVQEQEFIRKSKQQQQTSIDLPADYHYYTLYISGA